VRPRALLQFGSIVLHPAVNRRMIDVQTPFEHHLFQVTVAECIPQVPAYTEKNDISLEMTPLERVLLDLPAELPDDEVLSAVLGQCCYYRVSGRYGPAIVSVAFDGLLGAWRIDSYRGPANAHLKPAAERHILEAFSAVGIRFFGDYPRERALEWSDLAEP